MKRYSIRIDLRHIRALLPPKSKVKFGVKNNSYFIHCLIDPPLTDTGSNQEEQRIQSIIDSIKTIVGKDNISEIYRETVGSDWKIFLKTNDYMIIDSK